MNLEKAAAASAAYRIGGMEAIEAMGYTNPKLPGARWESEAVVAAIINGWDVVEANGSNDYQGWGRLLLKGDTAWATLGWSYGCDGYEDMATADVVASLGNDITVYQTEEEARLKFAEGGW